MKNYTHTLLLLLVAQIAGAQIEDNIVKDGNYTVTVTDTLEATQSILLKPNTWIQNGSIFLARIISGPIASTATDPYSGFSFSNENYIFTRSFQTEMVSFNSSTAKEGDVVESITYLDGLGRPMQSVGIKASPTKKDIIIHIAYDDFARQAVDWLPYAEALGTLGTYRGDVSGAIQTYYKANYSTDFSGITDDALINAYSEKEFENSPLNRVLRQAAPGKDWKLGNGHEIGFEYQTNEDSEVLLFTVTTTFADNTYTPSLVVNGNYYNRGELYKTITNDENWTGGTAHTSEEFKDKQGRVVLKRTYAGVGNGYETHDTNYVYDDYGNLTYVLPPKVTTNNGVTNTELNELCYQYKYDQRNRLVEKKIPGKDWEFIIYNKLDQPVLTQDANQRPNKEWLFTKYDAFGRVTYTGLHIQPGIITRITMQGYADATGAQYVTKSESAVSIAGTNVYYTNEAIPSTISKIYTVNYYDNYVFDRPGLSVPATVLEQNTSLNTNGLSTGSKIRVLETDHWITTVIGYDEKGRNIWAKSTNTYSETTDLVETKLDFAGKVVQSKTTHTKGANAPVVSTDTFTYDHEARLLVQQQTINSNAKETLVANTYNDLGQLTEKEVGGSLQTVDYTYNVRGWLKAINQDTKDDNDLFNFGINYNDPILSGATALFNGNISETHWQTTNDNLARNYKYSYDPLNRITAATGGTNSNYDVTGIIYDKNGNIGKLNRRGNDAVSPTSPNYDVIDNLDYQYDTGNKLLSVTDSETGVFGNQGFKDGNKSGNDYVYDANGNMISDANKGITSISYNYLSLPTEVEFNGSNTQKINYTYDASGVKLKKVTNDNGNVTTTDYASGYVYKNNTLQHFPHTEGYVEPDGNGGFQYVYSYVDHLGNVRLNYSDLDNNGSINPSTEILQERNTYPFGLEHKGYNNVIVGTENNHKTYQGQELNEDLGYNMHEYKWRHYDASIGRFNVIDPLATDFPQWAPYVFSGNFVTISKELEGLEPEFMINGASGLSSDNRLTTPMVSLLSTAFGYSQESLTGTTWLRDSDPRAHWFASKAVPKNAIAITLGSKVVFDRTMINTRSNRNWFSLIAHEQKHRSDIDTYGAGLFYLSYVLEGARVGGGHDDLGHEKVANTDEAYAAQLWNYNGGEVQDIFNMGSLTPNAMGRKMESVGARFRRDVILSDKIGGAESSLKTVQGALGGLGNSKEDRNIKAALGGLINSINQSIKDAKKEQEDITKKYGN